MVNITWLKSGLYKIKAPGSGPNSHTHAASVLVYDPRFGVSRVGAKRSPFVRGRVVAQDDRRILLLLGAAERIQRDPEAAELRLNGSVLQPSDHEFRLLLLLPDGGIYGLREVHEVVRLFPESWAVRTFMSPD